MQSANGSCVRCRRYLYRWLPLAACRNNYLFLGWYFSFFDMGIAKLQIGSASPYHIAQTKW